VIDALQKAEILPTAMIDISDGLSSELMHICKKSGVGCRIYEEKIPVDYQTALAAEEFGMNVYTAALNGGEDYEILFTVPLTAHELVTTLPDVKEIGYVTRAELGQKLVTRDGQEFDLKAQGWNPLAEKSEA
ncbi:MAG: AIR synthase-related protein, partial [Alloprevotella sp.]|nr:AIR synthase-related protein [Bacteroidales bacterium]MDY5768656.1 AIR synthase-related protein [Alloprevotella sp.]